MSKERPTFSIIEGYDPQVDYNEFKEDFLNPKMMKEDLIRKYDISIGHYNRLRKRVLAETGLARKPYVYREIGGKNISNFDALHIHEKNGYFAVIKCINYTTKQFGRYNDFETACMIRDKLVECNWDEDQVKDLIKEHEVGRRKPSYEMAKLLYDEFKEYYFDTSLRITDIIEKMGISSRVYFHLRRMIDEEFGANYGRKLID